MGTFGRDSILIVVLLSVCQVGMARQEHYDQEARELERMEKEMKKDGSWRPVQGVAGGVKEPILTNWDRDRARAIAELKRVKRRVEIHEADKHYAEAWNYYLTNSLYLPEPVSQKAAAVFEPLREILAIAKFPEGVPRRDSGEHKRNASDRLEELRVLLRTELGVVNEVAG